MHFLSLGGVGRAGMVQVNPTLGHPGPHPTRLIRVPSHLTCCTGLGYGLTAVLTAVMTPTAMFPTPISPVYEPGDEPEPSPDPDDGSAFCDNNEANWTQDLYNHLRLGEWFETRKYYAPDPQQ